jgi:hypothetical protein
VEACAATGLTTTSAATAEDRALQNSTYVGTGEIFLSNGRKGRLIRGGEAAEAVKRAPTASVNPERAARRRNIPAAYRG